MLPSAAECGDPLGEPGFKSTRLAASRHPVRLDVLRRPPSRAWAIVADDISDVCFGSERFAVDAGPGAGGEPAIRPEPPPAPCGGRTSVAGW